MARRPLPLANIITLGVQNFDAQRDFYRRLGSCWGIAQSRSCRATMIAFDYG
jgi:hypothetical protein